MNRKTEEATNTEARGPISTAMKSWLRTRAEYQRWLNNATGEVYPIDEIALLFRGDPMNWIRSAVAEPGVKLFNSAHDHVETHPIHSHYDVNYDFLEYADAEDLRIEVMHFPEMVQGFSPLHMALMSEMHYISGQRAAMTVVHLSFKVPDVATLQAVESCIQEDGGVLAQACQSNYGFFSYWKIQELWDTTACLYLKPRVNMRDVEDGDPDPDLERAVSEASKSIAKSGVKTEDLRGDFGMPTIGRPIRDLGARPIKDIPQA